MARVPSTKTPLTGLLVAALRREKLPPCPSGANFPASESVSVHASYSYTSYGHHLCQFEIEAARSETTLNYQMMVERYPTLKEEVVGFESQL